MKSVLGTIAFGLSVIALFIASAPDATLLAYKIVAGCLTGALLCVTGVRYVR